MEQIKLFNFQKEVLQLSKNKNKVAYYYDMGLGKTFIGSEKIKEIMESKDNCLFLVICQKTKIKDWLEHFKLYYDFLIYDLTKKEDIKTFLSQKKAIGIINYDLIFRRAELLKGTYSLLLDESSLIQNTQATRTKFILKLKYEDIILLSGTPISGKYENLYSQLKLLGYNQNKIRFYNDFIIYEYSNKIGKYVVLPRPILQVKGYKNVDVLKKLMSSLNCYFKKAEEVLELPKQYFIEIKSSPNSKYKEFLKNKIVRLLDTNDKDLLELEGDHIFKKLLGCRYLCSFLSEDKINKTRDLLQSTEERLIIFYQFKKSREVLINLCKDLDKPYCVIDGENRDFREYEESQNSVTLCQYQTASMGLNLQKANKVIYFEPTLSSDLYEQSKKRIHRIGQKSTCFYYILKCGIEFKIYSVLDKRENYTRELFINDLENNLFD